MTVLFLAAARQDALAAEDRLERETLGFGSAFTALLNTAAMGIADHPLQYPRTFDGPRASETREYYMRRFEYRVIFARTDSEIGILVVVHARRRPRSWVRRLRDLN